MPHCKASKSSTANLRLTWRWTAWTTTQALKLGPSPLMRLGVRNACYFVEATTGSMPDNRASGIGPALDGKDHNGSLQQVALDRNLLPAI